MRQYIWAFWLLECEKWNTIQCGRYTNRSEQTLLSVSVCLSLKFAMDEKYKKETHEFMKNGVPFANLRVFVFILLVFLYANTHTCTHAHAQSETEMNESSKCYELHFACSQKGEKKQQHGIYFRWPSRPPFFHSHSSGGENFIYLN